MANLAHRYVALIKEVTYGSESGVGSRVYGEVDSESMTPEFDIIDRADITRYGTRKTVIGVKKSGGDLTMALQGDEFCGRLFAQAFGGNTKTGAGPYANTLSELTDESNFLSYIICVGRDGNEHRYLGQCLDSLSLSATVNEYVMMTASFVGCGEKEAATALVAPSAGQLHANDAYHFAGAMVSFEEKTTGTDQFSEFVKSVEVEISLNRDTDAAYALANTTYTRAPPPTNREITGTIEFNRQILAATVADNEPHFYELVAGLQQAGTTSNPAISLYFDSDTSGEGLELNLINVQYEAPESNVSGRDTQTLSLKFKALYDETAGCMATAIWNTAHATSITA